MNGVYVAINGDDVGSAIGSAIASDDRESLNSKSSKIKDIHAQIEQWVEGMGGEIVSSSGDEGIYIMPEEALQHLEDLKDKYESYTGHTLTIGIGDSMSQAAKALIYGKITDKNTIVEYHPEIEQEIAGIESGSEQDVYAEQHKENLPAEEEVETQRPLEDEEELEEPEFDGEYEDEDQDQIIEDATGGDDIGDGDETPEHEEGMSPEEEVIHDAAENEADELDEDIIEADEEAEGEGIDGEEEMEDGDLEEEDQDSMLEDMVYSQMQGEEMPEEGMEEEAYEEEMPEEEPLPEEPVAPEEEMSEERIPEDDPEKDALKQEIAASLMTFKKYRDVIQQAEQQAPEFYQAMIVMLRSMIEMAKKLNMSPEQDMMQQENMNAVQQELPAAGAQPAEAGGGEPMMMSEEGAKKTIKKQKGSL